MAFDASDMAIFMDDDMPNHVTATVAGTDVDALFRNAYRAELGIGGTEPSLLVPTADVSTVIVGDAVVVNATNYAVTSVEAAEGSTTRLHLHKT